MSDEMFDYHREMTEIVVTATIDEPDDFVWVMNLEHRKRYLYFMENIMGVCPDDSESFGFGIMTGEPRNGEPIELCSREDYFDNK